MRDNWTETTLGEIAEVIMGRQLSPSKKMGVRPKPYLRAANIGNWGINLDDVLEMDFTESEERQFASQIGDVLLVEGGNEKSVGCPALVSELHEGLCIQNTIIRCRVKDLTQLSPNFLYHSLRHSFWLGKFGELCAGTTIMHLGQKRAIVFPFNVPPIAEQKRIVDVVSSVDAYIDALQQQVHTARTARNAVLHELLSAGGDNWTETTLGEIASWSSGKNLSSDKRKEAGQIPILGANGIIGRTDEVLLDEELITVGRVGACGETHRSSGPVWISDNALIVLPTDRVTIDFLYYVLSTFNYKSIISGTTQPLITQSKMKSQVVNLPPIAEQHRIVDVVSSMDDVIQATESAVVEAKNLRSGLLSDLLSGEHEIPVSYDELLGAA